MDRAEVTAHSAGIGDNEVWDLSRRSAEEHVEALRAVIASIESWHAKALASSVGPSQDPRPELVEQHIDAMRRDLAPWQQRLAEAIALNPPSILLRFESKEAAEAFCKKENPWIV